MFLGMDDRVRSAPAHFDQHIANAVAHFVEERLLGLVDDLWVNRLHVLGILLARVVNPPLMLGQGVL